MSSNMMTTFKIPYLLIARVVNACYTNQVHESKSEIHLPQLCFQILE